MPLVSHVVLCTQSAIGHISLRLIISMIPTCVLTIPGGEDLLCGAWFTSPESRGRSCWTFGNKLPRESLRQSALLVHRANQWASMDVCDKRRGGCGTIMKYFHSAASIAHKEAKTKTREPHRSSRVLIPRRARMLHVRCSTENFRSSTQLRDRSHVAVDGVSPEHLFH